MIASHLRIGNIVALEDDPMPQRIMVLSPGCIHLENCSVEADEKFIVPVPITELFLSKTEVSTIIQIQQQGWHNLYTRPLESLNNYLQYYKQKNLPLSSSKSNQQMIPVQFYFGKTVLLKVSYVHHLQNVFFNLSRGHELFPFPFNPYPEEKNSN